MKDNFVKVVFVVDESGSMYYNKQDVIGGFASFIEEQKKVNTGNINISLYTFSNYVEKICSNASLDTVVMLDENTYKPIGSTALYDALGTAIDETGAELRDMKEEDRPSKVLVIVMTDGEENSSRNYSASKVKDMIAEQEEKYSWKFIYMGADITNFADSAILGLRTNISYDSRNTTMAYNAVADMAMKYRTCSLSAADASVDDIVRNMNDEYQKTHQS